MKQEQLQLKRYVARAACGNSIEIVEIINDEERIMCEIISDFEYSTTENWEDAKLIVNSITALERVSVNSRLNELNYILRQLEA